MQTSILLLLAVLLQQTPPGKKLPEVPEPNWKAWSDVDESAKKRMLDVWSVLKDVRPDRNFKDEAERERAYEKVEEAY